MRLLLEDIDMKKVTCSSTSCAGRRIHYEDPMTPRGPVEFWVPHDTGGPWYCSIECSIYGRSEMIELQEAKDETNRQEVETEQAIKQD